MMKPPALSVLALAVALPSLPACLLGGDDDAPSPITWRVPCGSHGAWQDGRTEDARYTYDARNHLLTSEVVDGDGARVSRTTRGWDGDDLIWAQTEVGTLHYRNDFAYEPAGRLVRWTRTDLALEDDNDSFIATYTYAGGELVGELFDWIDPARVDRRSTITGERSTRMTSHECRADSPVDCDLWVWEQPDGDPDHWTRGTVDFGTDGTIDGTFERTLDANHLDLVYAETWRREAEGAGTPMRIDTTREADGTALGAVSQWFGDFGPFATLTETNQFECASARAAAPDAGGAIAPHGLDLDVDDPRFTQRRLAR